MPAIQMRPIQMRPESRRTIAAGRQKIDKQVPPTEIKRFLKILVRIGQLRTCLHSR